MECMTEGLEHNLDVLVTYRWTKEDGSQIVQLQSNPHTLSFGPLRLTDAGNYTCRVTINSDHFSRDVIATSYKVVRLQSELRKSLRTILQ